MQKINIDRLTVIFVGLIVVIVFELVVLFPWGIRRMFELSRKINLLSQQIEATKADWPRLNEYSQNQDKLKQEIQENKGKFIFSSEISESLSFISTASKEFGVEIESFLPEKPRTHPGEGSQNFLSLSINIKAKAKFHNLAMFLNYLQNSRNFFDLKQLKIISEQPYNSVEMVLCGLVEE